MKIKFFLYFICCSYYAVSYGQLVDLKGQIIANDEVEGIHIINKTSERYTSSLINGTFVIPAKINDTILVSGVQYQVEEIIVNHTHINAKQIAVYLEEQVNTLDEVVVGKVLTGDLSSDINNAEVEREINFYDLGIPGYTGKPKTQNERRLFDADHGKFAKIYGLFATINVNKILNRISGRTKRLKYIVSLDHQYDCMLRAKNKFSDLMFGGLNIEEELIKDYFYYVAEDSEFITHCDSSSDLIMFDFLTKKLLAYNENRSEGED